MFRIHAEWVKFGVLLSIYAFDGSVLVSHGGADSGQGINIKVWFFKINLLLILFLLLSICHLPTSPSHTVRTSRCPVHCLMLCREAVNTKSYQVFLGSVEIRAQ